MCDKGWTGNHCNSEIDECASDPCRNGGTCKNIPNGYGYECRCPLGTTGRIEAEGQIETEDQTETEGGIEAEGGIEGEGGIEDGIDGQTEAESQTEAEGRIEGEMRVGCRDF